MVCCISKNVEKMNVFLIQQYFLFLGGFWNVQNFSQISGALAIEFGERCYIKALDNGLFVLGPPHDEGNNDEGTYSTSNYHYITDVI